MFRKEDKQKKEKEELLRKAKELEERKKTDLLRSKRELQQKEIFDDDDWAVEDPPYVASKIGAS